MDMGGGVDTERGEGGQRGGWIGCVRIGMCVDEGCRGGWGCG